MPIDPIEYLMRRPRRLDLPPIPVPSELASAVQPAAVPAEDPSLATGAIVDALRTPDVQDTGIRGAIGRALTGFSKGFSATPQTAGYHPIAAGIAGGLSGTGQLMENDERRRAAAQAPRDKIIADIIKAQAVGAVEEPMKRAAEDRQHKRQQENIKYRHDLRMKEIRSSIQQKAESLGIDPRVYEMEWDKAASAMLTTPGAPAYGSPQYYDAVHARVLQRIQNLSRAGVRGSGPKPPPAQPQSEEERAAVRKRLGLP